MLLTPEVVDQFYKLGIGLGIAFASPLVAYPMGFMWNKITGTWQIRKIRGGWTIFCLVMPFICLGMMEKKMAEDNYYDVRALWAAEPILLIVVLTIVVLILFALIIAISRVWNQYVRDPDERV
jgi:E3 ubiquitin-protein ligase DOA10